MGAEKAAIPGSPPPPAVTIWRAFPCVWRRPVISIAALWCELRSRRSILAFFPKSHQHDPSRPPHPSLFPKVRTLSRHRARSSAIQGLLRELGGQQGEGCRSVPLTLHSLFLPPPPPLLPRRGPLSLSSPIAVALCQPAAILASVCNTPEPTMDGPGGGASSNSSSDFVSDVPGLMPPGRPPANSDAGSQIVQV